MIHFIFTAKASFQANPGLFAVQSRGHDTLYNSKQLNKTLPSCNA